MRLRLLPPCVLAAVLLAGCGTATSIDPGASSTTPPGGSATAPGNANTGGVIAVRSLGEVVGNYVGVNYTKPPKSLVPGTVLRLQVSADSVSLFASCNHLSGPARVEGGRLIVTDLSTTAIGCLDDRQSAQDAWLATYLTAKPVIERSGPFLTLRWGDRWLGFGLDETRTGIATHGPAAPLSTGS